MGDDEEQEREIHPTHAPEPDGQRRYPGGQACLRCLGFVAREGAVYQVTEVGAAPCRPPSALMPAYPSFQCARCGQPRDGWAEHRCTPAAAEEPDWLTTLARGWQEGRIPPAGLIWEDPPPPPPRRNPRASWGTHIPNQGVVPILPDAVRRRVFAYLWRHPRRWARVYDGTVQTSHQVGQRLRRMGLEVTKRGLGTTVALYGRCTKPG